jgi:hypothetical protein
VLFQIKLQGLARHGLYRSPDLRIPQFGLGLAFKLGVRQFYGNNGGQAFAHVFPGQLFRLFGVTVLNRVVIDGAGQSRAETGHVHSAFGVILVVGVSQNLFVILIRILDGYFHHNGIRQFVNIDWRVLDFAVAVHLFDVAN